jgi:hypothetical protein
MSSSNLEEVNEEFNNFMYKVNQVNNIVQKLASSDKKLQEIGDLEAKQYLGEIDDDKYQKLDVDNGDVKIKSNKTVINKKALLRDENSATQSQGKFNLKIRKKCEDICYRNIYGRSLKGR